MSDFGGRHLAVETWLTALGVAEYLPLFTSFGGVEDILEMTERDLNDMGVRNGAHRARMISSLVMLREKLNRTFRGNKPKTPRSTGSSPTHSNGASPPSLISSVDYVPLTGPSGMRVATSTHWEMQELRKYMWYHGNVLRHQAEVSVARDGDFLVRDSISQPGDFVLTCYWRGAPLHFVINRTEVKTTDGKIKVQYQFEENLFDRVSELITFYISNKKAISEMSGAVISTPVHKAMFVDKERPDQRQTGQPKSCPMSPIMMNSGWYVPGHGGPASPRGSPKPSPLVSPNTTPSHSPQMQRKANYVHDDVTSPSGRHPVGRHGSMPTMDPRVSPQMSRRDLSRQMTIPHSCTCAGIARQKSSEPLVGHRVHQASTLPKLPSDSNIQNMPLPKPPSNHELGKLAPVATGPPSENIKMERSPERLEITNGQPVMRRPSPGPPPKPSRIPSIKKSFTQKPVVPIRNQALYEDDGKDYTDYDQLKAAPSEAAQQAVMASESAETANAQSNKTVKRPGSSLTRGRRSNYEDKNQHNLNEDENMPNNPSSTEEDYDNNFGAANTFNQNYDGADYDTPRSNHVVSNDQRNSQNNNNGQSVPSHSVSSHSFSLDHIDDDDEQTTVAPTTVPKRILTIPDLKQNHSTINVLKFESGNIPPDNKPLEGSTMATIKQVLLESEPSVIARHLAKVDLDTLQVTGFHDLGVGVFSGLELMTLPQGSQLRRDIIERHRCMSHFVALMILTCLKYPERSLMLHQWIQIAGELRSNLGDLYGFSAVMTGLQHPQIRRLRNTWVALKQNYRESCALFDTKLCGMLNTMDEGGGTLPLQNVSLPHILPLIEVLERELGDLKSLTPWELNHKDLGIDTLLAHLDTARIISEQCGLYRVTGENALRDFSPDLGILDMFRTEMHLKLLWGSKGAAVNQTDRFNKFTQVLVVLSEKVEPPDSPGNPETSV